LFCFFVFGVPIRQHAPSILGSLNISAAEDVELMITTLAALNVRDAIQVVLHQLMLLDLVVIYVLENLKLLFYQKCFKIITRTQFYYF